MGDAWAEPDTLLREGEGAVEGEEEDDRGAGEDCAGPEALELGTGDD